MADTYADDVIFLANMNGSDGATSYTPEIGPAETWSFLTTAQLDTAIKKFGSASALLDGSSILIPNTGYFNELHDRTTDWTVDCWFYVLEATISSNHGIFAFVSGGMEAYITSSAKIMTRVTRDGGVNQFLSSTAPVNGQTWHYLRIIYTNATLGIEVRLDGTQIATGTLTGSAYTLDSGNPRIGRRKDTTDTLDGHLDALRVTTAARPVAEVPTEEPDLILGIPAYILAPHPLSNEKVIAFSDYYDTLAEIDASASATKPTFTAELSGTPALEVKIGSWQATAQTDRTQYVQVVVNAVSDIASDISSRYGTETFTVYRTDIINGATVQTPMATATMDNVQFYQGPTNYSVVISGYIPAATALASPKTYTLTNVRLKSIDAGGKSRMRSDITYGLLPGDTVQHGSDSFTADYINYYATVSGGNYRVYMDVGAR